jgi:hypothetical protein
MYKNINKIRNLILNNLVILISLAGTLLVNTNILAQVITPASTNNSANNSLYSSGNSTASQGKIGGNRDSHGCLTGAGYSWCELGSSCVKYWELANCFETKSGKKFAREFNNFTDSYALDTNNNSQPNKAIAAKKLCNPDNNFWNNISSAKTAAIMQTCFPGSSNDSSGNSSKKSSLITIADDNVDPMITVPEASNAPVETIWCDTMRRKINPQEFDLTDPKDFNDFCNPTALDTPNFF